MENRSGVKVRSLVVLFMIQILIAMPFAPPATAQSGDRNKQRRQSRVKDLVVRRGPEVAARVRSLRAADKRTNAALKAFEKKGRSPNIDEAVSITARIERSTAATRAKGRASLFERISFVPQQVTASEGDIELIFITALGSTYEWQGTVIANRYDEWGNLLQRYVADVVFTASDYNPQEWAGRYEVMFDEYGTPWLKHEPGMYTGFSLGTSIQEHQTYFGTLPPFDLESWQFTSPDQQQQYYEIYPQQQEYNRTSGMEYQISRFGGARFIRASFGQRSDRAIERHQLRPCSETSSCRHNFFSHFPGLGAWGRETGITCGIAAGVCTGVGALFTPAAGGGCFVGSCGMAAAHNARRYLF